MRRSLLVTVPSFSPQVVAGSSRSAIVRGGGVAIGLLQHHELGALQRAAHGGLVGHRLRRVGADDPQRLDLRRRPRPRTSPPRSCRAAPARRARPTARPPRRGAAALARSRCAPSRLARPPTSRPPIALGWPVSENGPAPGLPIWPVARCRLISAAFLSVPLRLWFRPWQYSDSVGVRVAAPNQRAACTMSLGLQAADLGRMRRRELAHAVAQRLEAAGCARRCRPCRSGLPTAARAACRGTARRRCRAGAAGAGRPPRRSRCGAGRRRSASAPGWRGARPRARRNSTGCAQAMFEPVMKTVRAWSDVVVAGRRRVGAQRVPCSRPPRCSCTGASWCRRCWCRAGPWPAC